MKNNKLLVHFGAHKTGSSAIQNAFYSADLRNTTWGYLSFDTSNSSFIIGNAFFKEMNLARRNSVNEINNFKQIRLSARNKIINSLESVQDENILLSAEAISYFDEEEIRDFIKFFKVYFQKIGFIGYLRDPVSYKYSAFQEALKRKFINLEDIRYPYADFVNNLDRLIGEENVKVFFYDKSSFKNRNILNHFQDNANININNNITYDVNNALKLPAIKLLYIWRKFFSNSELSLNHPQSLSLFIKYLEKIDGDEFAFNKELADMIQKQSANLYQWLNQRFSNVFIKYNSGNPKGISELNDLLKIKGDDLLQLKMLLEEKGLPTYYINQDLPSVAKGIQNLREYAISDYEMQIITNTERTNNMIQWLDNKKFSLGGVNFTIDITPGAKRRQSEINDFTLVKTQSYIDEYVSLKKEYENILELGLFQGGSLVFLDKLLSPKNLVGIDIMRNEIPALEHYIKNHANHIKTYYGVSQDDQELLHHIIKQDFKGKLDLVVDDASHLYHFTKKSFQVLFPLLSPGGLYMIEDWAWSHRPNAQVNGHPWADKPALTNLIFELIAELAGNNQIEDIIITNNIVKIRKAKHTNLTVPILVKNYNRSKNIQLI